MSLAWQKWLLISNMAMAVIAILFLTTDIVPNQTINFYIALVMVSFLWFYFPITWGIEKIKARHLLVGILLAVATFCLHRWGFAYFYSLLFIEVAVSCLPLLIQGIRFGAKKPAASL